MSQGKKRVKPAQTIATMLRKRSPRLFDGSRVPKCKSDEQERLSPIPKKGGGRGVG